MKKPHKPSEKTSHELNTTQEGATSAIANAAVAEIFDEIADLLEVEAANSFRIRAYRAAATTIRELGEPLATFIATGHDLTDLPGIGADLAAKITTILKTGSLPQLTKLRTEVPPGLRQLLQVPGLGPKKARQLHEELGLENLDDLRAAATAHKVRHLRGFGEKTERAILQALDHLSQTTRRLSIEDAKVFAENISHYLRETSGVTLSIAGSYRRHRETVGDLDILVSAADGEQVMKRFARYPDIATILARGPTKLSVRLKNALQVDLRVVPEESAGAALLYFTGSKEHNIVLRRLAQERGLKLNEYGVFRGEERLAGRTEEDVYATLGLPWIPPELREARGEIDLAYAGRLPQLIELNQLRGDLHMHTLASDGRSSLEEMVAAARERGYAYIAITDHSQRATVANGLSPDRLRDQWRKIDALQKQTHDLRILKGVEVDILENGALDLPDDLLSQADWVIASIHYGQRQPRHLITERLIGAITHPLVSAIAHPSGRIIGKRPPYDFDLEAVLKAAAEHRCALEINGQPSRLDLDDSALIRAKHHGTPLVINSDAHSALGLKLIEFGVYEARRGWIEANEVANTRSLAALRTFLKERPERRWRGAS